MAKVIITIEDKPDGAVELRCEPSAKWIKDQLMTLGHEYMSPAQKFGMTALTAIADANKRGREAAAQGERPELILPPGLVQ